MTTDRRGRQVFLTVTFDGSAWSGVAVPEDMPVSGCLYVSRSPRLDEAKRGAVEAAQWGAVVVPAHGKYRPRSVDVVAPGIAVVEAFPTSMVRLSQERNAGVPRQDRSESGWYSPVDGGWDVIESTYPGTLSNHDGAQARSSS